MPKGLASPYAYLEACNKPSPKASRTGLMPLFILQAATAVGILANETERKAFLDIMIAIATTVTLF